MTGSCWVRASKWGRFTTLVQTAR